LSLKRNESWGRSKTKGKQVDGPKDTRVSRRTWKQNKEKAKNPSRKGHAREESKSKNEHRETRTSDRKKKKNKTNDGLRPWPERIMRTEQLEDQQHNEVAGREKGKKAQNTAFEARKKEARREEKGREKWGRGREK